MARITIRNLPDPVHQLLADAAVQHHRSTEAEIRFALQQYAASLQQPLATAAPESTRQRWQRQTGQRIAQLFVRLRQDEVFAQGGRHDVPHLARAIGEDSPANLLDCIDGRAAASFDLLRRISLRFNCSESWLLSGAGTLFPWEAIEGRYHAFFLGERDNEHAVFRLIRISGGHLDGTLLCIRYDNEHQHFSCGYIRQHFQLRAALNADEAEHLCRFIQFLKSECANCQIEAYDFTGTENLTDVGEHHPLWFMAQTRSEPAEWLKELLRGNDKSGWFNAFPAGLQAIGALPFGNDDQTESEDNSWSAID